MEKMEQEGGGNCYLVKHRLCLWLGQNYAALANFHSNLVGGLCHHHSHHRHHHHTHFTDNKTEGSQRHLALEE